jgi:hypothetical protein
VGAVKLVGAVCDQHHCRQPGQPPGDVVEELACRGVGPVNVLDDEQKRPVLGGDGEQREDRLE